MTCVVTPARTTGSTSVISYADNAAVDMRQQLITHLFIQHGCYPSCMSTDKSYYYVIFMRVYCTEKYCRRPEWLTPINAE